MGLEAPIVLTGSSIGSYLGRKFHLSHKMINILIGAGATGAIAGIFFGIVGMLLGPFIGAVVGELSGGSDMVQSGRAGVGAWIGMVIATAVKLAIAFLMVGIFIFQLGFGHMGVTA